MDPVGTLRRIAFLLERQQAESYRVRAYRKAAARLEALPPEELLRRIDAGTESMLTVAMQSGFNNTANFNKTFRRYTGRTPSEYRRHGSAILY